MLGETHKYFREYFEIGTRKAKSAALEKTKTVKIIESARSQTVIGGRRDDLNDSGSTVLRLSVETASRAPRRARRGPGGEGGRATLTASAAFPAGRFVSSCVFRNLDAPRRLAVGLFDNFNIPFTPIHRTQMRSTEKTAWRNNLCN